MYILHFYIQGAQSNIFFQLVLISCMATNMVVYKLEQRWAKWACDRLTEDADFGKKKLSVQMKLILISAGMHSSKIVAFGAFEKPMHPKRVTVWCEFWSRGVIEPFFFENEQGEAVTVNGDPYRSILNEFLFTTIEDEDIGNIWFQHDAIISRRADVACPSRSCDLTPLDYYLWGAVKDKCYADKPETIDALKDNIREAIGDIQLQTIDNVLKNGQPRQPFEWNYFTLLTGRIVLSNKKRNLRKYSVFFFIHFPIKKVFCEPCKCYIISYKIYRKEPQYAINYFSMWLH